MLAAAESALVATGRSACRGAGSLVASTSAPLGVASATSSSVAGAAGGLVLRRHAGTAAAAAARAAYGALPDLQTARAVQKMRVRVGDKVAVVLRQQLDNLGHKGEEVRVAPGYARNYLVPGGLAVYATDANRAKHKVVLPPEEARAIAQQREVNMLRARVGQFRLRFTRATKDGVHMYGSVTAADIVEGLKASVLRKLGIRERNVRLQPPTADEAAAAVVETPAAAPAEAAQAETAAAADAAAPAPAAAAAPAAAMAPVVTSHAIKTVGAHTVQIEPRPGLWCTMTVVVESS